jgi:(R,R)-butanediol dehydrogenase/meso-butanediol dehydrogenase/diacetyl reductase
MQKAAYYEGKRSVRVGPCVPEAPGPDEVQLNVAYCGICGTDLHLFNGNMDHRLRIPQVFGHEVSGTIRAVGERVKKLKAGDHATVRPINPCGDCPACRAGNSHVCQRLKFLGIDAPGALQSLWTVPAHTLHLLPNHLPLETAALVEPLAVACHDVRRSRLQSGEYVVIQGGGPIGMLIAIVAKQMGGKVLITEVNQFRLKLARDLGFEAMDPQKDDIVRYVTEQTHTAGADIVFEVSGSAAGAASMTKLARVRGRVVVVAVFTEVPKVDLFQFFWRELELLGTRLYEPQDFEQAIELASSETLPLDRLISKICSIETVPAALHELESGGEAMKIIVQCSEE